MRRIRPAYDARVSHVAEQSPASSEGGAWWRPGHPAFAPLSGFFAGVAFAIAVPGLFAALLGALSDGDPGPGTYAYAALALLVPLAFAAAARTRRFGLAMLLGTVSTVLVVVLVAAIVLWLLVSLGG